MKTDKHYTCPCCGFDTFNAPPGSEEICRMCYWQDDYMSLLYATVPVGPNKVSLVDAQNNFASFGAKDSRLIVPAHISRESTLCTKDPQWRKIDLQKDFFLDYSVDRCPDDLTQLYYWLDTYWLKDEGKSTIAEQPD